MTNDESTKLAEIISDKLARLKPDEVKPWLDGFVSTHSSQLVHAVNLIVKDDERYKDAVCRMHAWHACFPKDLVSWLHVSPETETSLRMAASWASAPLASRNQHEKHTQWSAAYTAEKEKIGLPNNTAQAHDMSNLWAGRAFLNKNGVALYVLDGATPWPDEIKDLVAAAYQPQAKMQKADRYRGIILCNDGRVIKGLRTWPRG